MTHPFEIETGWDAYDILDALYGSPVMKGTIKGYLAERKLELYLSELKDGGWIEDFRQNKEGSKLPDFVVTFKGNHYLIECKTHLASKFSLDIMGMRNSIRGFRLYDVGWLDILASVHRGCLIFLHESKMRRDKHDETKYNRVQSFELPWSHDLVSVLIEADCPVQDFTPIPEQSSILEFCN